MSSLRLTVAFVLLASLLACQRNAGIPDPGSKPYINLVSTFYVGLAALQAGEDVRARQGLTRASQIAPGEPAGWANLSLLELRQQQYDQALQDGEKARTLAPDNAQIEQLLGLIESKRGKLKQAIAHLQRAIALAPTNLKALYSLAGETERTGSPEADTEARNLVLRILRREPNNQAALLDALRFSAKLNDRPSVDRLLRTLRALSQEWPEPAKQQLVSIANAASSNVRSAAVPVQFLRNLLVRDVTFRRDLDAIRVPPGTLGEPFPRFLRMQSPSSLPAPSDLAVRFDQNKSADSTARRDVMWAGPFILDAQANPRLAWSDRQALHLDQGTSIPLPAGTDALTQSNIAFGDLNYDFKTDIVMATSEGLRIYQQGLAPLFTDVTSRTKLPAALVNNPYTGVWLFDYDLDGDLDLVLGRSEGNPVVLRNNGDGTYKPTEPFSGVNGLRAFAAADLDADGDPDVVMITADGQLRIFTDERLGNFRLSQNPLAPSTTVASITTGDINGDGRIDVIALTTKGEAMRISNRLSGTSWETGRLVQTAQAGSQGNVLLGDIDNNGSLDLVIGKEIFLHDSTGFSKLKDLLPGAGSGLLDQDGDGRLDVLALGPSRELSLLMNHGTKPYKWQTLRTRAAQTSGDQRINAFGIGGEVEVRSGLLTQKQNITSPVLHFGLGDNGEASLARIVWPNGQLQVEFDLKPDAAALAVQRLKGSCPFLFSWDGHKMAFVKDCAPWSPALGLHVNAQQVAGIGQTEEWFKIPGTQVAPHDGVYDLRITGEYWETFYIDHYAFLAVDHPDDTEIFTDERFAVPAPPLAIYSTNKMRPFAQATDDGGLDVRLVVNAVDGTYLDTFGRGRYQGVTRDHWVELELPTAAPRTGSVYLIGTGWLHPTDATVNVALSQGNEPLPQSLSIEVENPDHTWRTVQKNLGFPAGRIKNVVLNLSGIFPPTGRRALRLRTNLEIYWDRLGWATAAPDGSLRTTRLELKSAKLDYRGFSHISQANASSPELPDYGKVEQRGPRWRDLEGYYTRFGDVLPLIEKVDSRILITNAGDELRMTVPAPPPPPAGWKRDLIMIGNGWIKDGDYNCVFSKTVLPLPYQNLKKYTKAPESLEKDPAYRLHPEDWTTFHTRYVGPEAFSQALWHSQ